MRILYKILSIIWLSVLFVACTDSFDVAGHEGSEVELTFHFETDAPIITRAISDGTSVDQLTYAIFTSDNQLIHKQCIKRNVTTLLSATGLQMTITLAQGHQYKAVFWAQSSECEAYTVSDDMKVTVDYNGANNDENRDAFYGVSQNFYVGDEIAPVVLKRPFAQVNVVAFPFDWEYATQMMPDNFNITKTSATIRDIANEIDLVTGAVSGHVNASFTPAPMPQESYYADVDENGVEEEYTYLSMSYVLADDVVTEHHADFFYLNDENKAIMNEKSGLTTIQLKRNTHADIVGQVVTDNGEINVREYKAVDVVYHNASQDTVYNDIIYNMSGFGGMQFASTNGQKSTLNNVYITGDIWTIELGEYRGSSYVNYNNELNNVVLKDLRLTSAIECHEWYFSPAVIAYGNTVVNNCTMTGATTTREPITDKHGVTHEVIPADFAVRNESDCVINGGYFGTVFAWTHAVVDIFGATIEKLYCGTCDSTKHSWMTIGSGTKITEVICCEPRCPYGGKEYSTTMTIKSGAEVGSIQLVSTDVEFLIIEDGAKVGKITCEGVEYTYKELREAMGL